MGIRRISIRNFKYFREFTMDFDNGINIIVGNNESGKSTVLEAVHLALTGTLNGRYIGNELSQYLFHVPTVAEYLCSLTTEGVEPLPPPRILIEVYFEDGDAPILEGDGNSERKSASGVSLEIAFDEDYTAEYKELISFSSIATLPIEYYTINWYSFARDQITSRRIPVKTALIDSSTHRYQNGSDVYVSRIIRNNLTAEEVVDISQAYRKMREAFMSDEAMERINHRLKEASKISEKNVRLSADLSPRNAWETSLMTYLDEIPFHQIGRGEQCVVKTKLALGHQKAQEASVILIEEPENHLSHTRLNSLIQDIDESSSSKQVLLTTHSSFVANKLGIGNLVLLNNGQHTRLRDLDENTLRFFRRLSGYDTLRLLLCNSAILVEGDSDELVVQKAYMIHNDGRLPIQDGIDIISVGTAFLRFLEIAEKLKIQTVVVTDNDGDVEALQTKYQRYLGRDAPSNIRISYEVEVSSAIFDDPIDGLNYNTLEATILRANGLSLINDVLGKHYSNSNDLLRFMTNNKTECALRIFETDQELQYPEYILNAIK